ncbi:ubiquitin-like modifier-activating enzyme 6 [Lineus longissimus]|uniref:ubiquitin-like modifier-activating enzyme 6 n=1 Tax=Lineus longissimus TaxID=88925 RepID=UPI002B4DEAAC
MAAEVEIDDALYSRQRYVLGDNAMQRMAKSNILLYGLGGLGVEIAKNIVLAGIKNLVIQDSSPATYHDLGTQFFLKEEDVKNKTNRADASCAKIAELNPYVSVKTLTSPLSESSSLDYMKEFQCVILTEASLSLQLKVDAFCRSQNPPIKFIAADVYGVFSSAFCDFGDNFEVLDQNGEEPKEVFISDITKANPGVVTCIENFMHGFEDGDTVRFREVNGMDVLNGRTAVVKVLTPETFSICDTSGDEYDAYQHGGVVTQIKVANTVTFQSLEEQVRSPSLTTADLAKFDAPPNIHLSFLTLQTFRERYKRLPNAWCNQDAKSFIQISKELNEQQRDKIEADERMLRFMSFTSRGQFAPLTAALGGIVAQEALKALTGKFTPLQQWLHIDASEILSGVSNCDIYSFQPRETRYDALRVCIGEELCQSLANLRLFMVGCGAIGCEMMKNYALLGIGSGDNGLVTITDNDLIEKSNLNRQFLFRPRHIQKPKSSTAASSTLEINPGLHFEAQQHKVCPQTEYTVYNDEFFMKQDIVVNALDNLEARRYMDSRCVSNQRPLLESGTMGAKGHVQVIVPHLTESYSSQRDPPDEDVPYCTLKSFPATIEHCIQWARDKFESAFSQKPAYFNKFWTANSDPSEVAQKLDSGQNYEGVVQVSKTLMHRACKWEDCVALSRIKFEKYFNHKAKQLVHVFPLDTKLVDGSLFWQSPKRPPNPILFNFSNPLHMLFVKSGAKLYASVYGVQHTQEDMADERIVAILNNIPVPKFVPSSKKIETDEAASKPANEYDSNSGDELKMASARISKAFQGGKKSVISGMKPAVFEKDDDSNGHIDFITAAANARAEMYSIEQSDRLKVKRIAGRIVPAIATTTAAVAGLVTVELIKVVQKCPLEMYKNCFLNLALPVILFSEPGAVEKSVIKDGLTFTLWDHWDVYGSKDFTLQNFLNYFKTKFGLDTAMVVHGVKMIYVPIMPGHKKRLPQTMLKLIKCQATRKYVDLIVSFEDGSNEEIPGPPVRYFLGV